MDVARLLEHEKLDPTAAEAVRARGAELVPELLALFEGDELEWAPIHAVGLLVDLHANDAIERLLDVLVETSWDTIVHDRVLLRLPELGAPVVEPALRRADETHEFEVLHSLAAVLAKTGVRDDRIRAVLDEVFEEDVVFGASLYADYGDASAARVIEAAILEMQPDFEHPYWAHDLAELMAARRELGGEPSAEIVAHGEALMLSWRQHIARAGRIGSRKIGRNDPCPCRSGKKFKKCCALLGPPREST